MTFQEWLSRQPESAQTWHRCDLAARDNPGHPHHKGAAKRIRERLRQWRAECPPPSYRDDGRDEARQLGFTALD